MNRSIDARLQTKFKTALLLLAVALVLILPGFVAAQDAGGVEVDERPETQTTEPQDDQTHAVVNADADLLVAMRNEPERFIGRKMTFLDGTTIGPVLDMRRKSDDLELYLVVDATAYFNSKTIYAVNAKDVQSVDEESILVPMESGMHLRGLVYYPEDYQPADDFSPE